MISQVPRPHYLLFTEAGSRQKAGRWRFVVKPLDGGDQVEVVDYEAEVLGDRLDLLTVIRGLESLDQPSQVTLVTSSRYVKQGIDQGLASWRENDWTWERFGERVEIKHCDLWRRLDRALSIHEVQCRKWRVDRAHGVSHSPAAGTVSAVPTPASQRKLAITAEASTAVRGADTQTVGPPPRAASGRPLVHWRRVALRLERWLGERLQNWRLRAAQCGSNWLPAPWLDES
jgi:ribonuclease HI